MKISFNFIWFLMWIRSSRDTKIDDGDLKAIFMLFFPWCFIVLILCLVVSCPLCQGEEVKGCIYVPSTSLICMHGGESRYCWNPAQVEEV